MTKELFNSAFKHEDINEEKSAKEEETCTTCFDKRDKSELILERRNELVDTILDLLSNMPKHEAKFILDKAYNRLDSRCIVAKQEAVDEYYKNLR